MWRILGKPYKAVKSSGVWLVKRPHTSWSTYNTIIGAPESPPWQPLQRTKRTLIQALRPAVIVAPPRVALAFQSSQLAPGVASCCIVVGIVSGRTGRLVTRSAASPKRIECHKNKILWELTRMQHRGWLPLGRSASSVLKLCPQDSPSPYNALTSFTPLAWRSCGNLE